MILELLTQHHYKIKNFRVIHSNDDIIMFKLVFHSVFELELSVPLLYYLSFLKNKETHGSLISQGKSLIKRLKVINKYIINQRSLNLT